MGPQLGSQLGPLQGSAIMVDTAILCLGCMLDKSTDEVCAKCGYALEADRSPLVLPYRTVLNERFLVGRVVLGLLILPGTSRLKPQ